MKKVQLSSTFAWMTATFVACSLLLQATPASAAWTKTVGKTTGSMGMASLAYTFTPVNNGGLTGASGGTGGSAYASVAVGVVGGTTNYINITNNSTVTANPSVTVTPNFTGAITVWPSLTIKTCATAWNTSLGTCAGGATQVANYTAGNTAVSNSWGSLTSNQTSYIQVSIGGAIGNVSATASVASSGVRAGTDRTSG